LTWCERAVVAAIATTALALVGVGAAGCASPGLNASHLVGLDVAEVKGRLPRDITLVTYDLSSAIVGRDPDYGGDADDGAYSVVAACTVGGGDVRAGGPNLAVAIIPTALMTRSVGSAARRGAYDRYLTECTSARRR
jgi:hypothetical protein